MPTLTPYFRMCCKTPPRPVCSPQNPQVFVRSGAAAAYITSGLSHPFPQTAYYAQAYSKPAPCPPVSYSLASPPVSYSLASPPVSYPPVSYPLASYPPVSYPLASYFTAPVMSYPSVPQPFLQPAYCTQEPDYYTKACSESAPYPSVPQPFLQPAYCTQEPDYYTKACSESAPYPSVPHPFQIYRVEKPLHKSPKQEPIVIDPRNGHSLGLSITNNSGKWLVRRSGANVLHSSLVQHQGLFKRGIPLDDIGSKPPLSSISIRTNDGIFPLYEYLKKCTNEVTPAPPPVATAAATVPLKSILKTSRPKPKLVVDIDEAPETMPSRSIYLVEMATR